MMKRTTARSISLMIHASVNPVGHHWLIVVSTNPLLYQADCENGTRSEVGSAPSWTESYAGSTVVLTIPSVG